MRQGRNHNLVKKTELNGFRRKAARRVEAMDGRATKLSLALSSALPKLKMNYNPLAPFIKEECGSSIPLYQEGVLSGQGVLKLC